MAAFDLVQLWYFFFFFGLQPQNGFLDAPVQRVAMLLLYTLDDGGDDYSVSRARSAARAYRSWSSISVVGCAPPNTRRAVRLGGYRPGRAAFKGSS